MGFKWRLELYWPSFEKWRHSNCQLRYGFKTVKINWNSNSNKKINGRPKTWKSNKTIPQLPRESIDAEGSNETSVKKMNP